MSAIHTVYEWSLASLVDRWGGGELPHHHHLRPSHNVDNTLVTSCVDLNFVVDFYCWLD